jgi:hypothetical protein
MHQLIQNCLLYATLMAMRTGTARLDDLSLLSRDRELDRFRC